MSDAASEQQPLPPAQLLRLLAHGLSDAQIAELLVISPRTVNTHLRSISSKLGLTSRHAVTRYALDHHLVYLSDARSSPHPLYPLNGSLRNLPA